jgi:hypothetical protein
MFPGNRSGNHQETVTGIVSGNQTVIYFITVRKPKVEFAGVVA